MRRNAKLKSTTRVSQRKTALSANAAARRSFPAWIDAGEPTVTFAAARSAMPRVRDGLVLRRVRKSKSAERRVPHGPNSR
jgi:hypothetical protein